MVREAHRNRRARARAAASLCGIVSQLKDVAGGASVRLDVRVRAAVGGRAGPGLPAALSCQRLPCVPRPRASRAAARAPDRIDEGGGVVGVGRLEGAHGEEVLRRGGARRQRDMLIPPCEVGTVPSVTELVGENELHRTADGEPCARTQLHRLVVVRPRVGPVRPGNMGIRRAVGILGTL